MTNPTNTVSKLILLVKMDFECPLIDKDFFLTPPTETV